MDILIENIGQIIGAFLATISALFIFYLTKVDEKKKEQKKEKREEKEKINSYGRLLWTLSQELSLTIRHKELVVNHVSTMVEVSKDRGEILNKKNSLFFSIDHLKLYRKKILEEPKHHPLLVSVLSVFIATLETANMSLDFEQLYDLSSKTKSKEEFNKVLDMYFTTFKEDYMDRIDTQNEKIQEMIEEELKSLNPDISRLKDEKSTEKLLKIIVPEVIEDKDESMNNIGTKIKN
jgi:hypothetical protein